MCVCVHGILTWTDGPSRMYSQPWAGKRADWRWMMHQNLEWGINFQTRCWKSAELLVKHALWFAESLSWLEPVLSYLIADHRFTVLSDAYQSSWMTLVDWIAAQPLTWTLTQQNVMCQTFDPLFKVEDPVFRIRTCKSVKTGRAERQKLEINADRQDINLENLRSNFSTVTTWKCD